MPNRTPFLERFNRNVSKTVGCWLWVGRKNRKGYGLLRDANGRPARAHRVAWQLANGPIPDGLLVCHRCDNPSCVRVEHLFLGTNAENLADMTRKGRRCKGERHHMKGERHFAGGEFRGEQAKTAKLTAELVREIRAAHRPGRVGCDQLARRFGVHKSTVARIINRELWGHV